MLIDLFKNRRKKAERMGNSPWKAYLREPVRSLEEGFEGNE